jgi:hypothetical protein
VHGSVTLMTEEALNVIGHIDWCLETGVANRDARERLLAVRRRLQVVVQTGHFESKDAAAEASSPGLCVDLDTPDPS